MIGTRMKQAREAAGLSTRDLAEKAGVSAMAISKYERDASVPSSKVLLAIARELGVRTEYFYRQKEVELADIEFRERDLSAKDKKRVVANIEDALERWMELEDYLPTPLSVKFENPLKGKTYQTMDDLEEAAIQVRKKWKLGENPIPDLIDVLEEHGILVVQLEYDADKAFDGLSAKVADQPVIVVGKDWPGDRQRFTLAHELGHLVLEGKIPDDLNLEKACNRFAGAFLVPEASAKKSLGASRKNIEPREYTLLKMEWGLSMQGWLMRSRDLGIVNIQHYRDTWKLFESKGWKEVEPVQFPAEKTALFEQLVFRALAENLLSESKAAELMAMPINKFHDIRKLKFNETAHQ